MSSLQRAAEEDKEEKDVAVSLVSFVGFGSGVSAKELADFLEYRTGVIWRCRVKTSWTPPDSLPYFDAGENVPGAATARKEDYPKVAPHAFVYFACPMAAQRAVDAAKNRSLFMNGRFLRANAATDNFRLNKLKKKDPFKFVNADLDIGILASRDDFVIAWEAPQAQVEFTIDPSDGHCRILFPKETSFCFKDTREVAVIKCNFKLEFLVRDVDEVKVFDDIHAPFAMMFRLGSVPHIYYRTADHDIYDSVPFNLIDDGDPWVRTTDFTAGRAIGRCNTYRISFSSHSEVMKKALKYLKGHRVTESKAGPEPIPRYEPDFGLRRMSDHFFSVQGRAGISFSTMFLVNALVHKGIVNQHQLSKDFFDLLRFGDEVVNETSLKHIWAYKTPIFDAHRRLKTVQGWVKGNPKLLNGSTATKYNDAIVEVRRLVVTPTKAYCLPPETELSNRVLRHYKDVADRFLRVTFMDEGMQQMNNLVLNYHVAPIVKDKNTKTHLQKTTVFGRIKDILINGFHLCGRKYSFLAFSSNQLRDRSAWFFAEGDDSTTAATIRNWMGKFDNKNVAKCAARMGQCFSSTYATVEVTSYKARDIRDIEANGFSSTYPTVEVPSYKATDILDIEANGYVFSDGIGKITPELTIKVAEKLQLADTPSAYQIRYAGCKGVVACWPEDDSRFSLSLRNSMKKFDSDHTTLEVVSWTRFQPGFLNRQIVTLLSTLGVPDSVFSWMQDSMIHKLNQILVDTDIAFEVLTTSCAEQGNTAALMLSAGFKPLTEPHLKTMLSCIRSAQLGDLLEKARIFVPKGRWLMGCLDELAVLEYGQCFIQTSIPYLENSFRKRGSRFSRTKNDKHIILGTVAIAKNPCLHPGDIRILEAVDVPSLHHLVDCLVFPQKGVRPHANEASGSDLDGDLYFVTWDENLIPPSKRSWSPMDYTPAEVQSFPHQISPEDIIDFFLKNMVNENLGVICNAHVVHADVSASGALDDNCLKLAEMAAIAVDFPKTGKLVTMPLHLKPEVYPDFMGKDDHMSYKSKKILGKLYRSIRDATRDDLSSELVCNYEDLPYDSDLQIAGSSDYIVDAWEIKVAYETQLNALLGRYKLSSEGEVVTGHIWSLSKYNSRKQGELKERLRNAYSAINKEFRRVFENIGTEQITDDEKNLYYERKASAWYQVTYHPQLASLARNLMCPDGEIVPVRLSFPWIAADYLCRIKVRCHERRLDGVIPIDSLAAYLSDRI